MEDPKVSYKEVNGFRHWWKAEYEACPQDDLCRMLRENADGDELLWLLQKPQWIIKRLQNAGISGIDNDIGVGLSAVYDDKSMNDGAMLNLLKLIAQACRMSAQAVANNPSEAWFQLYGRLLLYADECGRKDEFLQERKLTIAFLNEIRRCAPRPWFKPDKRFLTPAGFDALERIDVSGDVLCLNVTADYMQVLCDDDDWQYVQQYSFKSASRRKTHLGADPANRARCGAISANGERLVTGHDDGELRVWDCDSGTLQGRATQHAAGVVRVAISADGSRMLSASRDGSLRVWDTNAKLHPAGGCTLLSRVAPLSPAGAPLCAIALSSDGRRMACARALVVTILHDVGGELVAVRELAPLAGEVSCLAISADGKSLLCAWLKRAWNGIVNLTFPGGGMRLWSMKRGVQVGEPFVGCGYVRSVAFSADGRRVVTGCDDGSVCMWDVQSRRRVPPNYHPIVRYDRCEYVGHTQPVRCVAWSADACRLVSTAHDDSVRVWDTVTSSQEPNPGSLRRLAFSSDGRLLTCRIRWNDEVALFRTDALREAHEKEPGFEGSMDMVKPPTRCRWQFRRVRKCLLNHEKVLAAAFGLNDTRLATANAVCVCVWDIGSELKDVSWRMGQSLAKVNHSLGNSLRALWMSADGVHVAALGANDDVILIDMQRQQHADLSVWHTVVPQIKWPCAQPLARRLEVGGLMAVADEDVLRVRDHFITVRRGYLGFCAMES